MSPANSPPQAALKYELEVSETGRVELHGPFTVGERLTVIVVPETAETFVDLTEASQSSLDFWNNPPDDEDWNDASAGGAAKLRLTCFN